MMDLLLNTIATPAYADANTGALVAAGAQQSSMSFVVMFVIFFGFIYFAIWRPQNKRAREQQEMMASLTVGDELMTAGGIVGRITKVSEDFVKLSIANNVEVFLQKTSVVNVLPKGTIKSIE